MSKQEQGEKLVQTIMTRRELEHYGYTEAVKNTPKWVKRSLVIALVVILAIGSWRIWASMVILLISIAYWLVWYKKCVKKGKQFWQSIKDNSEPVKLNKQGKQF